MRPAAATAPEGSVRRASNTNSGPRTMINFQDQLHLYENVAAGDATAADNIYTTSSS